MIVVLAKESAEEFMEEMGKYFAKEDAKKKKKAALKNLVNETVYFMCEMIGDISDDCKTEEQFGILAKDFGEFLTKEREKLDL